MSFNLNLTVNVIAISGKSNTVKTVRRLTGEGSLYLPAHIKSFCSPSKSQKKATVFHKLMASVVFGCLK